VFLARRPPRTALAFWGPVFANPRSREAVRRLNDWFKLRDCPEPQEMIFPEQGDLFPGIRPAGCLRLELGMCLGPCTGTCTRRDYQAQARLARAFLLGQDLTPLAELAKEMEIAAGAQQFERAADLRDRLTVMQWLADRLARVRKAQQEMSFIYPAAGFDGRRIWYLIHGARTVGVLDTPHDADSRRSARQRIESIYRARAGLLDSYEHADSMMVVMLWFRKYPKERARCLTPEQALALP
jgi:excinuclease ABC subunit C